MWKNKAFIKNENGPNPSLGAMTYMLRRTPKSPNLKISRGTLQVIAPWKTVHAHFIVHLRPGNVILPQTSSGFEFDSEQGRPKQGTKNNIEVLVHKMRATEPVETNFLGNP